MCNHCTIDERYIKILENWAYNGVPCSRLVVLVRPTAVAYPNTYVFVFKNALRMDGILRDVFVDVHFRGQWVTPGAQRRALGGLWVPGLQGAMKPEQHGGLLRSALNAELPGAAPLIGIDAVYGDPNGTAPLPGELQRR